MSAEMTRYYHINDFKFHDESPSGPVKLAYLDLNSTETKTALVVTCFRGRLQSTLALADGALRQYRIIVVALFGNGESSSPSNMSNPPQSFRYQDCVRAQHDLLTSGLGIHSLDVIMGFSMGGQCAYYWTLMHPEMVQNAVIICSSARTSRHNYQFLEGPKAALEYSQDYQGLSPPSSQHGGLRAFGKAYSAWLTSPEWFELEMYKSLGYKTLEEWDSYAAGTNYFDWHPEDLLSMIKTWQMGDVTLLNEPDRPSLQQALSSIKARILLLPCRTDQYFRWEASNKEAQLIPRATFRVIPSAWGHLAGLGINKTDSDWIDKNVAEFLKQQD
ncbi:hypothetical protein NW762_011033 [Fusarium torreyae]|uniref:AB hydrolase-1 domain-containing protein n=1 Tax=Fusarium torreyae TaxID=1237075 RepID=A0A9W8RS00_9HYPO|nr:hypothetical protein NW762_011033 [Fusarium torreyae]